MRRASAALVLALAVACASCFHSTAPPGFLRPVELAAQSPFGGWIDVGLVDGTHVQGELIAAMPDTLHVLAIDGWKTLPVPRVRTALVTGYDVVLAPYIRWAALGAASTVSGGFFLILTAPAWALAGTAGASSASRAANVQSIDPAQLRLYARFPQGLPPGVERVNVRPVPLQN